MDSKKSFSKEDLKNVLENLNMLKNIINTNKAKLNSTIKQKEEKLKNYANINKKIELDFKENDKVICVLSIRLIKCLFIRRTSSRD